MADKKPGNYRIPIWRVTLVRDSSVPSESRPKMTNSRDVTALVRGYLEGVDREHMVAVLVDSKNRIIGIHTVSIGSLSTSVCHPREVFKPAILANAAAIVLAHNHPSGDPLPSREDKECTARMAKAAHILGIRLLDHVIVGEGDCYYSFADSGELREEE